MNRPNHLNAINVDLALGLSTTSPAAPAGYLRGELETAQLIMANGPFQVELTKQGMWLSLKTPSLNTAIEFENRQQSMTAMTYDSRETRRDYTRKRRHVPRRA